MMLSPSGAFSGRSGRGNNLSLFAVSSSDGISYRRVRDPDASSSWKAVAVKIASGVLNLSCFGLGAFSSYSTYNYTDKYFESGKSDDLISAATSFFTALFCISYIAGDLLEVPKPLVISSGELFSPPEHVL